MCGRRAATAKSYETTVSCKLGGMNPPHGPTDGPLRVIGYVRVSTEEQASSGAGLGVQRAALEAAAAQRGWNLVRIAEDAGMSAKSLSGRPALADALDAVARGDADALAVSKLDRLSRSMVDFAGLMAQATRERWALIALDLGVDTSTPEGEMLANVMASFAQFERRLIGQRTRDALAVKRSQGVRLGRRVSTPPAILARVVAEREAGTSWQAIADGLNADGVPTTRGAAFWRVSTAQSAYRSAQHDRATRAALEAHTLRAVPA
jgi:DNA invertase Pin-like site-specific DNA recombinase